MRIQLSGIGFSPKLTLPFLIELSFCGADILTPDSTQYERERAPLKGREAHMFVGRKSVMAFQTSSIQLFSFFSNSDNVQKCCFEKTHASQIKHRSWGLMIFPLSHVRISSHPFHLGLPLPPHPPPLGLPLPHPPPRAPTSPFGQ